jgi:hypothetical protein
MASWRDDASPRAQADLDELLDLTLRFAQQSLDTRGEFYPYAAAVGSDGQAGMIAALPGIDDANPRSADVIDACVAALTSKRNEIRAGAIVANVAVPELGGDAVRVDLEHTEGHAVTVFLPYTRKRLRRKVDYGELVAQPGVQRIWA